MNNQGVLWDDESIACPIFFNCFFTPFFIFIVFSQKSFKETDELFIFAFWLGS